MDFVVDLDSVAIDFGHCNVLLALPIPAIVERVGVKSNRHRPPLLVATMPASPRFSEPATATHKREFTRIFSPAAIPNELPLRKKAIILRARLGPNRWVPAWN